jgi:hypothetical protein
MKKYKRAVLGLLFILPFVAIVASLILVQQRQEVRRGAAYGTINLQLLPSTQDVQIDEGTVNVKVQVLPDNFLVSGSHFKINYDSSILDFKTFSLNNEFEGLSMSNQEGTVETVAYLKKDSQPPSDVFNLVTLTFDLVGTGQATLSEGSGTSFVGSIGSEGPSDRALAVNSFTESSVTVLSEIPVVTPTEPPGGWPQLTFSIKFGGTTYKVNDQEKTVEDIGAQLVDIGVKGNGVTQKYENVSVDFNEQAVGTGSLELVGVEPGDNYVILIKGPVHLARRFCEDEQSEHCWLGAGGISLSSGENVFNWATLDLEPGDIDQNGVVNSSDFTRLKEALMSEGDIEEDINFNGIVNGQDINFLLQTLSKRYEDEI